MTINQPGDEKLVAVFKHHAEKNLLKSKEAGRPIYDDVEIVEIHAPGSRNTYVFPSMVMSHWSQTFDGPVQVTYAERFSVQYRQFKAQQAQTISGTPLNEVPFLTEARKAELRALSIYTAEQLAALDGQELKNIGMGGRELKNKAQEYIDTSKKAAPSLAAIEEVKELKAKLALLEEDLALSRERNNGKPPSPSGEPADRFDGMDDEQLREFIKDNTGQLPRGQPTRRTLERMARESQQKAA